jgi:hypothetical protein
MGTSPLRILALAVLVGVSGSAGSACAPSSGHPPPEFEESSSDGASSNRHWPVSPAMLEELLSKGRGSVLDREPIATGVTGVDRFTVYFPDLRRSVRIKWKAAPPGDADGWNNAPRKELAAYQIQKWFLDPTAYVVPTTVARCVRLEDYRRLEAGAEPTFPGTDCVFGIQALWLEDVEVPDELYDEARFGREALYARHLANFNLFAYLIDDRDTRPANVLTAKDPSNRRVFSVDNGISFDSRLYNFFENEWKDIRVPALPRDSIDRLRSLTREHVESLGTVAQFRVDEEGMLRPERTQAPIDPERGVRFEDGVLQLGLTKGEIDGVWERIQKLLARVADGELPLF